MTEKEAAQLEEISKLSNLVKEGLLLGADRVSGSCPICEKGEFIGFLVGKKNHLRLLCNTVGCMEVIE